jgi:5-methylcytosine-specific restriction protein A
LIHSSLEGSCKNFLSEKEKELLMAVYYFPNHSARASDIYILLGYTAYQPINSLIGKLGKKISIRMDIPLTERYDGTYRGWDVLFTGETIGKGGWLWKMKEEVISVLEEIELVEKTFFKIQEDSEENKIYIEGAYKTLLRNFYERNPLAREKCIKYYGYKCFICGFDFNEFYGALGKNFIEVHHLGF